MVLMIVYFKIFIGKLLNINVFMLKIFVVIDKLLRYVIIYNYEVFVVWLYIECINVWLVSVIDF